MDIHTRWVERQAVMGKGQHGILQALTTIAQQLPFALRGLDADNVLYADVNQATRTDLLRAV